MRNEEFGVSTHPHNEISDFGFFSLPRGGCPPDLKQSLFIPNEYSQGSMPHRRSPHMLLVLDFGIKMGQSTARNLILRQSSGG